MRRAGLLVVGGLLFWSGCGKAPEPAPLAPVSSWVSPAELREQYEQANQAREAADIPRFCELTEQLVKAWPDHPRLVFDLACAHALAGRPDAAFDQLERLVAMRVALDVAGEEDLASLHELPRFAGLLERLAAATAPMVTSEVAFRLEDPEFVPEDVAWDPVSGDYLVSSIRQRKVVRVALDGAQSLFAGYPEIDMLAALSMAVDSARRRLWLTTAASPSMVDYRADAHEGHSELLCFDLEGGTLVARVEAPAGGERHELNDLAVEADGSVLVGDAPMGAIYRLRPDTESFEVVVAPGTMFSPQGIAILSDGGPTLVADYTRGLCALGPSGDVRILESPPDAWLGGIDGLNAASSHELLAVQSGITPSRVVRIRLSEARDAVEEVEVLDLAHPEHDQPTLGEVVGNDYLHVANSLWGAWDRDGNKVEGRSLSAPVILRIPLR